MRRGALPYRHEETVYYAQLKTPAGLPPVARVLQGSFKGPANRPSTSLLKCPHATFYIEAPNEWLDRDVVAAAAKLYERIRRQVTAHTTAINQLHDAATAFERTLLIQWTREPPPQR